MSTNFPWQTRQISLGGTVANTGKSRSFHGSKFAAPAWLPCTDVAGIGVAPPSCAVTTAVSAPAPGAAEKVGMKPGLSKLGSDLPAVPTREGDRSY